MNRLRFVLDTNVLVSALRSKRGASFSLVVHHLDDPRIEMQVSNALMLEYQEILHRERPLLGLSEAQVEAMLDGLLAITRQCLVYFTWRPASRDPDDDFVVDLAFASGAKCVVTHNVRDFQFLKSHGIEAVTPKQFIAIIEKLAMP